MCGYLFKLNYRNLTSFLARFECDIVGNPKAHALLMDVVEEGLYCCNNRLAENDKRLICIWTKASLSQRKYWSKCYSNSGPSTNKTVQAVQVLSDRFCCSRYHTATVKCRKKMVGMGGSTKRNVVLECHEWTSALMPF